MSRGSRIALAASAAFAVAAAVVTALGPNPASAEDPQPASAVTKTATVTRTHLVAGLDMVADSRDVSVTVSQTEQLRAGQQIRVTWSGAHPTGGVVTDPASDAAAGQEYPMLLMQCRGLGTDASPITPETCWTQSPNHRYSADNLYGFPAWRLDRYADAAQRVAHPGSPDPVPAKCFESSSASAWVPFIGSDGTVYPGGPGGCAGAPSEAASALQSTPANTTFGVTNTSGDGSTRFEIWDSSINQSLGCSTTVPCSLVAVPIMGIGCDVAATGLPDADRPEYVAAQDPESYDLQDIADRCMTAGSFAPGSAKPNGSPGGEIAVSGAAWWSESNWQGRITFPLSFAETGEACSVTEGSHPTLLYGSTLFAAASQQWVPAFCTDPERFTFRHIQYSEPQSLSLVSSPERAIEAALVSTPSADGYTRPTVNAPIGASGFAISYLIDGADKNPYTTLQMTPRLLAKLLTGSYPANPFIRQYKELPANPLNLTADPEFLALNPGVAAGSPNTYAASTLYALSSDSDVMTALTSYITADPEARAWLDGEPDPWGMVVNPPYKGIALPVSNWPLIDPFAFVDPENPDVAPTFDGCAVSTPYLNLLASPTQSLRTIATALKFGLPQSQVTCQRILNPDGDLTLERFVAGARQTQGFRFMIGITSLADSELFQLDTAALQSHSTITDFGAPFDSDAGRDFVAPTQDGLRAAVAALAPVTPEAGAGKTAAGSYPMDYARLASSPELAGAYPGTMLIYAVVPTKDLAEDGGTRLAQLLRFAVSEGQTPGFGVGQLPSGYLPLTAENGAAQLVDYTWRAAAAVEAQAGEVPSLIAAPPPTPTATPSSSSPPPAATTPPPTTPAPTTPAAAPRPAAPTSASTAAAPATAPAATAAPPSASASTTLVSQATPLQETGLSLALPVLVGLAVASALVSAGIAVGPHLRRTGRR